jgi:transposase-like protein
MPRCKLTKQQRIELVKAADDGETPTSVARRFGVSTTLVCWLIQKAKQPPNAMLDLYNVLKRKVGGKAAREMIDEHMRLRGISGANNQLR